MMTCCTFVYSEINLTLFKQDVFLILCFFKCKNVQKFSVAPSIANENLLNVLFH